MSKEHRSATRDLADRRSALVPRYDEAVLGEETEEREKRAQTVDGLRLLWESRRFLIRATGFGLILGLLFAFLIRSQYDSTTRLMPPDQNNSSMQMLAVLAGKAGSGLGSLAGDVLGLKSSGALFVGILQSRTVQDDVIGQFNLRKAYGTRRWEDARNQLADKTAISEDRKSGIITVRVSDRNPQRAAAMAREYVEELNRVVAQVNTTAAHRERVFLEDRLSQVKQDLESAEKNFSEFASRNTALNIPEQGKAMIEAAAALQGELIATQTELEALKQVYTDSNVRVRSAQARVDELRLQLQKLGGKSDSEPPSNNGDTQTVYPSIHKLPLLGVGYADLFRQTKVEEAIFESLTQEYELTKVEEAKETPSVKVLDPADVPEKKSFPPRGIIALSCSILALFGGGVLVFARARWDQADPNDPGKALAREVVQTLDANMPWATPNGSRFQAMTSRIWTRFVRRNEVTKTSE
jgi:uncharacterized protein involved in exopolysaccharide biosynthesis